MENTNHSKIEELIGHLKQYDYADDEDGMENVDDGVCRELLEIGEPAVPFLIERLQDDRAWISNRVAIELLGEIGDSRAIAPLADVLENEALGEHACEALEEFGTECIPAVIKRIEHRIANPVTTGRSLERLTAKALEVVGEIQCEQSSNFLNNLLDDYMAEMPQESFDPTQTDWKYRNVDFFHLLDCMVRQQNTNAIPHLKKARDTFPREFTEYIVCQIAIGRIKKGRVEGYLPMEAMEIAIPSDKLMRMFTGEEESEENEEDELEEMYGEYLRMED